MVPLSRLLYLLYSLLLLLLPVVSLLTTPTVTVFGASGGVGQLICNELLANNCKVRSVTRSPSKTAGFELLNGCELVKGDARDLASLPSVLQGSDMIVISVGTTAFPTSKWKGGNDPETACVTTVHNILSSIPSNSVPKKILLLSSAGVTKGSEFPFSILNLYGILDAKKKAEDMLLE